MPSIKNKVLKLSVMTVCTIMFSAPVLSGSADYMSRRDTVSLSAGNAKDSNNAIHAPTPWPYRVNNTRIPGDAERGRIVLERMYDSLKTPQKGNTTINIGVPGSP